MTTLRQFTNFDSGLKPLSDSAQFRFVAQEALPPHPSSAFRYRSWGHFPATHGTANTSFQEKWLLAKWATGTAVNLNKP